MVRSAMSCVVSATLRNRSERTPTKPTFQVLRPFERTVSTRIGSLNCGPVRICPSRNAPWSFIRWPPGVVVPTRRLNPSVVVMPLVETPHLVGARLLHGQRRLVGLRPESRPGTAFSVGLSVAVGVGLSQSLRPHPLMFSTCLSLCTGSARSFCRSITSSIGLYAPGISSITPASFRHSIPAVYSTSSAVVNCRFSQLSVRRLPDLIQKIQRNLVRTRVGHPNVATKCFLKPKENMAPRRNLWVALTHLLHKSTCLRPVGPT